MLLAGNLSPITVHTHHIQNHGMMNQTVNRRHGGHRILEDAFPFAKHQIRGDHHGLAFIALGTLTNIVQISIIHSANSFR